MELIQFIYSNLFLYSIKVDKKHINLIFIFHFRTYIHLLVITLLGYIIDLLSLDELIGSKISFKIDISKTPTIPSLAFRIFRTHFLGNKKNTYITREIV